MKRQKKTKPKPIPHTHTHPITLKHRPSEYTPRNAFNTITDTFTFWKKTHSKIIIKAILYAMINPLTIPYFAMPLWRSQLVIPLPVARSAVRIHYDSHTNLITNNQSTILHTQCRILSDLFSLWFATSKMVHIWCQKNVFSTSTFSP